jgi:hypothetical protein
MRRLATSQLVGEMLELDSVIDVGSTLKGGDVIGKIVKGSWRCFFETAGIWITVCVGERISTVEWE